jgi:hypothetical protein
LFPFLFSNLYFLIENSNVVKNNIAKVYIGILE